MAKQAEKCRDWAKSGRFLFPIGNSIRKSGCFGPIHVLAFLLYALY
jgi:hypothetical protein